MLPVDGIVKCNGPCSQLLVNRAFWINQYLIWEILNYVWHSVYVLPWNYRYLVPLKHQCLPRCTALHSNRRISKLTVVRTPKLIKYLLLHHMLLRLFLSEWSKEKLEMEFVSQEIMLLIQKAVILTFVTYY